MKKFCHSKYQGCAQFGSIRCSWVRQKGSELRQNKKERKCGSIKKRIWGLNLFYISNCLDMVYIISYLDLKKKDYIPELIVLGSNVFCKTFENQSYYFHWELETILDNFSTMCLPNFHICCILECIRRKHVFIMLMILII